MRKQEMEIDYLAPFLAQMKDPEKIGRADACKLKEDWLAFFKTETYWRCKFHPV